MTEHPNVDGLASASVRGTPAVLRRMNRVRVLDAVRSEGPISRPALASITGLSKMTIGEVVGDLINAGLVSERLESPEPRSSRPGPRPRLVEFRSDARHVVGVDIGAAKTIVMIADLSGGRLAEVTVSNAHLSSRPEILRAVDNAITDALNTAGLAHSDIASVAVGTPGVVHRGTGAVTLAPQLPDWENIILADSISAFPKSRVLVENEVHLAVLGEQREGAAMDVGDAAYLNLGIGVGLGVIVDGELVRGSEGAAGEVGYLPIPLEDDPRRPSDIGRFEWAVGGSAYARAANASMGRHPIAPSALADTAEKAGRPLDAEAVFAAAAQGDQAASEIIEEIGRVTAAGIACIVAILNPATVIVGGGISKAGAPLISGLSRHLERLVPRPPAIVGSPLGETATVLGAIHRAIADCEAHLISLES